MAASGDNFQGTLGTFLTFDISKIRHIGRYGANGGLRARQQLRAPEMIGKCDKAAGCQNIDIRTGPCRFRTTVRWANQTSVHRIRTDCSRQRTRHCANRSIEIQLSQNYIFRQSFCWYGTKCRHQRECNWQIEVTAFLWQVSRSKVDRNLFGGKCETGSV
ncbi:hypothetical protein D3C80_1193630 [compost metagenome]